MVAEPVLLSGRENECQRLVAAWSHAAAGHPRVACILGDAGLGKTALLRWFAAECARLSPGTHVVRLSPPSATENGMAMAARALEGLLGIRPGPLAELEPALRAVTGVSEPDVLRYQASLILHLSGQYRRQTSDPAHFQASALAFARSLVVSVASREPVLFLLDDSHRTDSLARQWLADLLADASAHPCHLMLAGTVASARAKDLEPLGRLCMTESISLGPLTEPSARALLSSQVSVPVAESDLECALQSARGSPACLVAFGRALSEGSPVPNSWEDAIRGQIEQLAPAPRALADAVAVVGAPVDPAQLTLIANVAIAEGPHALPAMLVETPAGIWFNQSAVSDICLDLLAPARRTTLHRQAGAVFEPAFPLVAARHFERSGDRDGLVRVLSEAAHAASSRFALEEARALLLRALGASPGDEAPASGLPLALADIEITLGAYDEALAVLSRRAARLEGADRARAFRLMGRALERKGEYEAAKAHLQEGLAIPNGLPLRERAGLLSDVATILFRQGQMEEARRHSEQALGLLEDQSTVSEFALAHSVIGITYYRQGRFPQALSHHQIALEHREAAGDVQGVAKSLNNLGSVHSDSGNWDEALAAFGRALQLAQAAGDTRTRTALLNNVASLHLARGHVPQAEAACRESLEGKSRTGETPGIGIALSTLAAILGRQGKIAEALSTADEAIALLEEVGEREILSDVYACRGELLVETGDVEQAWAALSRAQQLAEEAGKVAIVARVFRIFSEMFRRAGRPDDSLAFAQEAVELNRFLPRKLELARSLRQLVLAGGDADGHAAREAQDLFAVLGVRPSSGAIAS